MNIIERMTTKQVVEDILKEYPRTRDDDFLLVIHTYVRLGFAKRIPTGVNINFNLIENAPSFETITRIRREIQNSENRFLPSQNVQEKRSLKRDIITSYYSSKRTVAESFPNSYLMA